MSQPPSVAPAVTAQPPRADGHMCMELLPPTLNASCPSRCHAKHPPARPEVPATYAQAAVTTTQGHSRPLKDVQPAQVPRLDTLQCHAPVTPLLLDPHLAFIVSPRPGV
ncbi:hypothetical protein MANI_019898 [Metarhizium anisopliae]|nr:hypothetical protein MANI_019898 [Metarhizium anisopliae]